MQKYLYQDLYELEDTHWWHIAKRNACQFLIKKFIKKNKLKILDVGCGTGKNLETFSDFGEVYGLDMSSEAIKFCSKRGFKKVKLGRAEKTPYQDKSFDLITLLDVLEHTDDTKTLKEIRRILKDQGYVIITVPAYQWLWSKWDEVLHHKRRYTKKSLTQLLNKSGFTVIKSSYMHMLLILPVALIRYVKNLVSDNEYSSDFKLMSPYLNKLLLNISKLELKTQQQINIPTGTSIICLAQKVSNA